jgi:hypothetical protein
MKSMDKTIRTTGVIVLAAAAAGAVAALLIRNQIDRHQRELFSPIALRRLAALGHMAREEATGTNMTLLRDFIAWEPRRMLRNRARVLLSRMEDQAGVG